MVQAANWKFGHDAQELRIVVGREGPGPGAGGRGAVFGKGRGGGEEGGACLARLSACGEGGVEGAGDSGCPVCW